jgi:hypothetical protein
MRPRWSRRIVKAGADGSSDFAVLGPPSHRGSTGGQLQAHADHIDAVEECVERDSPRIDLEAAASARAARMASRSGVLFASVSLRQRR